MLAALPGTGAGGPIGGTALGNPGFTTADVVDGWGSTGASDTGATGGGATGDDAPGDADDAATTGDDEPVFGVAALAAVAATDATPIPACPTHSIGNSRALTAAPASSNRSRPVW